MSTDTKRRGRPPKRDAEDAVVDVVEAGEEARPPRPEGPPCRRCGRPMLKSTSLLRRYEMVALKCDACREVSIEGDEPYMVYDTETAKSQNPPVIVSRAMAIYEQRRQVKPPAPEGYDPGYAAMQSDWDDERWTEIEF